MSDQPFEHAVRDWLGDGSDRTPRPAIDAVLLAVKTTRQERDLRIPRRFTQMPTYMRLAAAIAIVAVVGVGALAYFNGGPNMGGPPTAAPTATAAPSASIPPLREGALDPGRYVHDGDGLRVIVTVPEGWEGGPFNISRAPSRELPDGTNILFRQPTSVFADPCAPETSRESIGPTVDDLAPALADLPNVTDATQADVTISGFSGKHVSFVVDTTGIDCVMGIYGQDAFVRGADNGQREDLWILDVAGTRLVIDAATYPETSTGDRAEMQSIVETLLIEPTR
jgi:hypothetical protein